MKKATAINLSQSDQAALDSWVRTGRSLYRARINPMGPGSDSTVGGFAPVVIPPVLTDPEFIGDVLTEYAAVFASAKSVSAWRDSRILEHCLHRFASKIENGSAHKSPRLPCRVNEYHQSASVLIDLRSGRCPYFSDNHPDSRQGLILGHANNDPGISLSSRAGNDDSIGAHLARGFSASFSFL